LIQVPARVSFKKLACKTTPWRFQTPKLKWLLENEKNEELKFTSYEIFEMSNT
jgi:hypothetical protein